MLMRFSGFAGANKALHPLLLPADVGVDSQNQRPGRGDLRPWNGLSTVATVASGMSTIYRMGRSAPNDAAYWLAWSADVDVARGFIADDTSERTYWTGDGAPKWTDNTVALGAPPYPDSAGVRLLGVPAPDTAPTLAQTAAGSGDDETRAYVVTWVNSFSEESAPSTPVTITCKPGATIRVTRNAVVPTGAYGVTKWRVYRTVATGEVDYFFVGEYLAATTFGDDTGIINLSDPLLSESWSMPPAGLKGLKALWNGIMAAFTGKSLRFSEPFRPFAWPLEYELIIDDDIVAIAQWRQQLIVLTVGQPYLVTGSSPDAMSLQPIEIAQACVSKKGVVEFGHGVVWPSPDGLAYVGDGGTRMITGGIALRDDWQAFVPSTMVAGNYEGLYVGSYLAGGVRKSMVVDPLNPSGLYFNSLAFTACFWDPIADAFYVLNSTTVQKWHAGTAMTAAFESRTERLPRPTSFSFCQVVADSYPVTLSIWANGALVVIAYSVASKAAFRLPAGFVADQWKIRVSTTGAVQAVMLANSSEELRQA